MQLSKKILEDNHKRQQKEREEKTKRLTDLVTEIFKWFEEKELSVGDVANIIMALDKSVQEKMQTKTRPIIAEWNKRLVKDFYAEVTAETGSDK